ncbi:MAG TPA: NUDIX hydrolase [Acidiferrobacteraceae bacterium]|nr:NUDIX hydrolase [Acidiferrobacteraceae bacterium]
MTISSGPGPRYCSDCGRSLRRERPPGDERERDVCSACGMIHYQNPKVVVGAIPEWQGQVLLCRRAIEPRLGLWTLPAGFMENDETTMDAAVRETHEEAAAHVTLDALYGLFNLPHINQVYVMFRGHLTAPEFGPGMESLEVALFSEENIPWEELAFPVVRETLRLYFADRRRGTFGTYTGDLVRNGAVVEVRYLAETVQKT